MIYLNGLKEVRSQVYSVSGIHFKALDPRVGLGKTKKELEKEGVFIDNLPTLENKEGKVAKLYVSKKTGKAWYEYFDEEPESETKIEEVDEETEE